MGVGKLKEPGRGESVGFSLLVFIAFPRWLNFRGLLPVGATAGWKSEISVDYLRNLSYTIL